MTLSSLSFVVFLDPYQGSNGICLLSKYVVFLVWDIVALPSLSPYSNKVLISGAHRWETANSYLQDIYCIVKPWIQKNKSISQIKMCMCGEWMVYDGDNNGENNGGGSLILLLLFWGDTYLPYFLKLYEENEMLIFFSFLSGGYLAPLILLSDTCPFLPLVSLFSFLSRFRALAPFYFLVYIFFFFFFLFFFQSIHLLR